MQAADAEAGAATSVAEREHGQSSSCGPGDSGFVQAAHGGAHHIARLLQDPDSGNDATSRAERPGVRAHIFALSVPFPTPLEAEIACGALAPDAEPHRGALGKKLAVSGSTLAVHWTAEDSRLLRVSILSFLEQLALVLQTMRRFGPPVSR
ncbi:EKC/KEOPS complex subunit LAGE3 [Perognathus longimembris pacificus]|uniref:EKC/KEOPS complex subunit LAGE3 n=1 Tax=Perognathus longimembris pacificus TaxID=214514 RepID=UPI0020185179|nr:EKC/KEOPS complex subunit LAGE3 [Perognathus longimembris pacificus]